MNYFVPRLRYFVCLAAIFCYVAIAGAATTKEKLGSLLRQSLIEYSITKRVSIGEGAALKIRVKPLIADETYQGENIGWIAAEIVADILREYKQFRIELDKSNDFSPTGAEAGGEGFSKQMVISGRIEQQNNIYSLSLWLNGSGEKDAFRKMELPAKEFVGMLNKHLRWKKQKWLFQPYAQAMYTEGYYLSPLPSEDFGHNYLGTGDSCRIVFHQLYMDETADFILGARLIYHGWAMLDFSRNFHGPSTSNNQIAVRVKNLRDPSQQSLLLAGITSTAWTGSLNFKKRVYSHLDIYAGMGYERMAIDYDLSASSQMLFSGPSSGVIEVHSYFLRPGENSPQGVLLDGGRVKQELWYPLWRFGIEWRPRHFGFNFLAVYKSIPDGLDPIYIGVEEIYKSSSIPLHRMGFQSFEAIKFHLPRFSVGAAFTYGWAL